MIAGVMITLLLYRAAQVNTVDPTPVPLRLGRVRLPRRGQAAAPAGRGHQRRAGHGVPHPQHGRHLGLHRLRRLLEAPPHLPGPHQRGLLPPAPGPGRPRQDARTWTWRTSTRTPCSAWARSATSPGSRCSTSPPAPSAGAASRPARPGTPRSRCRPSCSSWACGTTCSPRPARCIGGEGEQTALVPNVIDPDVLWSCTTCGACVNECPVDIEHIDAIVDMRRYQVLMESEFPSEAGLMLRNVENQGDPWGLGPGQAHRVDREPRLRDPGRHRHHPRRRRVPLLGRLRRRPRRAGPQGRAGHRPHAAPGRRHLRDPGPQGVLHRRPGAPAGERVPLPGAGQAQHRHPRRGGRQEDHRQLPALLQHHQERVPGPRRQLRGHPPRPAARASGARRGS